MKTRFGAATAAVIVTGAIAIGAVLPVPGTSIVGALLSPVTGVGGSIYGAVVARPSDEIENAEAAIERALLAAERRQPGARLREKIIEVGRRDTAIELVAATATLTS